ncbi:MAG: HAMP domain-containing histidine kinase [Anaerolineae bacterium]|nr:HAMP domain-containing histidine kinase [Anaerolineae bacterium]
MSAKRFSLWTYLSHPFLSVHPLWALLEMWLLGLLFLSILAQLAGVIHYAALANGMLMMCGVCGMWAVLRARLPQCAWWLQVVWELAMGAAVSLIMAAGLGLPARWLGWDVVWTESNLGIGTASLVRLMTGFGYLAARVVVRLWLFWNRLRRRRMLWSLTHAHLITAFAAMMGVLVMSIGVILISGERTDLSSLPLPASFATLLFHSIFPAVSVIIVFTVLGLALVMPPSAILSFFAARKTTRRVDNLARAARAWREGNYEARAEVSGEDEVAQLQANFNAMAESLQTTLRDLQTERDTVTQLLEGRRELVANVSHELRTPVATMRALLESTLLHWQDLHWQDLHEQDAPSPTLRHELEVMQGEIERLQTLIDDLFTLSQAEVEHLTLNCRPTDAAPIVRQMVEAIAPLAWQSGRVQVIAELPAALPPAHVDGTRLAQILANLLRNAVRHTPPGGIVAAAAEAEQDFIRLEVRDTGEGIAEQDLPRIWERFYRGSNNEHDPDSAGLGLALVKELTEAMGGTVEVESKLGQGSCFTVRLPKSEE